MRDCGLVDRRQQPGGSGGEGDDDEHDRRHQPGAAAEYVEERAYVHVLFPLAVGSGGACDWCGQPVKSSWGYASPSGVFADS